MRLEPKGKASNQLRGCFQDIETRTHHFVADAIAWQHRDVKSVVGIHGAPRRKEV
jgi:hypothetical protein